MRDILPYDPTFCDCCNCSFGNLEVCGIGGSYLRAGYSQFTGPTKLFRSISSRGWGGSIVLYGATKNNVACSIGRAFEIPSVSLPRFGFCESEYWAVAYPWGNHPIANLPFAESLDCADGFFDFDSDTFSAAYHQAYELTNQLDFITGPRGQSRLFNEITPDAAFSELQEYVESLSWPVVYGSCYAPDGGVCSVNGIRVRFQKSDSGYMHYSRAQYRRRFPIPKSGTGVRIEWDIYFTPDGGTRTLFDTVSWQWDRVVPSGYDPNDADTWPTTPFFETPEFLGSFGDFDIAAADWRVECGPDVTVGTPGDLFARAA